MSQLKSIDGLKKKSTHKINKHKDVKSINFHKKKISKSVKIITGVLAIILILFGVLYLIPNTRAKINLIKMFWSGNYLILFQNNAELRSTGGFIGSYAVVNIKYGRIKNIDFETNIEKHDNEFVYKTKITPEDEIFAEFLPDHVLQLRDSNWPLDYSQAAKDITWLYKQEMGKDVDGVIAIDTEFLKNLLKVLGPINLAKYNLTIDENNLYQEIQKQVEITYFEDSQNQAVNEPKSIISDMAPIILVRLKKINNWIKVYQFIKSQLREKNLLLYSYNPSIQSSIEKQNWGGTVPNFQFPISNFQFNNYLYINNSNLGANKSSIYVNENIELNIKTENNKIINHLTIDRVYPEVDLSNLTYFYPNNQNNINYTRILVPAKSNLLSATINQEDKSQDIKTSEEAGKTKFGFWSNVNKGQETIIEINYETAINSQEQNQTLYLQKQPGAINQKLKVIIDGQVKYDGVFKEDLEIK